MNDNDYAALSAYTGQFRGEAVEETAREDAMLSYYGRVFEVGAQVHQLLLERGGEWRAYPTMIGERYKVCGIYGAGNDMCCIESLDSYWTTCEIPRYMLGK